MRTFPFRNPENQSWEDDADTVIFGDDLLEEVQPPDDDEYDTVPLGLGPFENPHTFAGAHHPFSHESSWDDDSVDEYLSEDVLEEAEPSAPNFSRPTFDGPLALGATFAHAAVSAPAYPSATPSSSLLRRSSVPPAPLPPLPSRHAVPPMRAEMPTPVMEILPTLDAIRPESRPPEPPANHVHHAVRIPPPSPIPRGMAESALPQAAPAFHAPHATKRADSHLYTARVDASRLDTLRPYATTSVPVRHSAPGHTGTPGESWLPTVRPWLTAAEGHLLDFWEYSKDALRELLGWVEDAWDAAWERSGSQVTARRSIAAGENSSSRGAVAARSLPAHEDRGSFWQTARDATTGATKHITLRTASWTIGFGFVGLLLVALSAPPTAAVGAAPPVPLMVDADAITGMDDEVEEVKPGEEAPSSAPNQKDSQAEKDEEAARKRVIERALAGDRTAVTALGQREPTSLSLAEVKALAEGEEKLVRAKTTQTILKIAEKRRLTSDDVSKFLRHVGNPRTYREALLAMAENRSWQGPDLIYLAMRRYRSQPHIVDFARSLLLTPRIYKYASPALTVVIDAESMAAEPTSSSECFHVRQLVDRVYEDGDSRAVQHMARFASTTGCGENDLEDCYPCLRDDSALVDALRSAKTRRPPL